MLGRHADLPFNAAPLKLAAIVAGCLAGGALLGVGVAALSPLAAVAAMFGLAVAWAVVARPWLGLLATCGVIALLPFGVIPLKLGAQLTLMDAALGLTMLAWLMALAVGRDGQRWRHTPANLPLLAFVGLCLASFVLGTRYGFTSEILRSFIKLVVGMLFFFAVVHLVRTRGRGELLLGALALAGAAAALVGLGLYYSGKELAVQLLSVLARLGYPAGEGALRYIAGTKTLRATATSIDPNILGGLLAVASLVLAAQLMARRRFLPRWLAAPGLALTLWCLLLTFSRGSWIALACGLLFLGMMRHRLFLALALAALVALYLAPQQSVGPLATFQKHLQSGINVEDQAAGMRLGEYKDALRQISEYPAFGVGFGEAPSIDRYIGVSNIYLFIAEETGLFGLAAFLATLGVIVGRGLLALRKAGQSREAGLVLVALATLVVELVGGMFDQYSFHFQHTVALFWTLAALAVVATDFAGPRSKVQGPKSGDAS